MTCWYCEELAYPSDAELQDAISLMQDADMKYAQAIIQNAPTTFLHQERAAAIALYEDAQRRYDAACQAVRDEHEARRP